MPIPKAVVTLSVPSVISSLVMVIYSLADTFFVGMMNDPVQNAAVTLAAPLLLAFNAVNNLFGIGSSSMMSRALGRKDYDTVYRSSAFGFYASLICSLLFSLLYGVLQSPILVMLGANAETIQATADYLFWTVLLGSAPSILNVVLAYLVRAEGSSLHASIGTMCGCLLNIVLDVWFVAGFHWDVAGVAIATIISQVVSGGLCLIRLLHMRDVLQVKPSHLRPKAAFLKQLIRLGLPSGLTQAIFSFAMIIVQSLTNSFGTVVIAANTAVMRVDGFAMMPNFTFGTTMTTYTGQNIGAGKLDRCVKGTRDGLKIGLSVSVVLVTLILIFGQYLMQMFTSTPEVISTGMRMLRILAVGYIAMGVTQILSGVMRGAGDTMTPMWISIITTVIIRVPIAYGLEFLTRPEGGAMGSGTPDPLFVSIHPV